MPHDDDFIPSWAGRTSYRDIGNAERQSARLHETTDALVRLDPSLTPRMAYVLCRAYAGSISGEDAADDAKSVLGAARRNKARTEKLLDQVRREPMSLGGRTPKSSVVRRKKA
jgi:hypothetical protein